MKKILIVLFIAFTFSTQLSFAEEGKKYEYMTIMSYYTILGNSTYVNISTKGKSEKIKLKPIKSEVKGNKAFKVFDQSQVIEILEEYNMDGWEVINSNFSNASGSSVATYYYFLKREKK